MASAGSTNAQAATATPASPFILRLGKASKVIDFSPLPDNPLGGFVYFNMSENDMAEFVSEGARLVNENSSSSSGSISTGSPTQLTPTPSLTPSSSTSALSSNASNTNTNTNTNNTPDQDDVVLFTCETSTLGMAHELRTKYGREVQIMTKKQRPNGEQSASESYCAITSTKPSTLYFKADFTTTKKQVVFFDNVCTTGETLRAAARVLLQLPQRLRISKAIMLFTEGEQQTSIRVSDDYVIPIVSFGHLPIIDLALSESKPQFVYKSEANIPTYDYGRIKLAAFTSHTGKEAMAAHHDLERFKGQGVPVRIHDACATSELFHSEKCDCREQLENSLAYIHEHGGMVIYLHQEGRGIGLANKLLVYDAQETQGLDTVDANLALGFPNDSREYVAAKDILQHFKIASIKLMSNNPRKREELTKLGVNVLQQSIPMVVTTSSPFCRRYLSAKAERMGHAIPASAFATAAVAQSAPPSSSSGSSSTAAASSGASTATLAPPSSLPDRIEFYEPEGPYGFLSNFYPRPVVEIITASITTAAAGNATTITATKSYPTSEHLYQAQKFAPGSEPYTKITQSAATAKEAFDLSREYASQVLPGWEQGLRVVAMCKALEVKFLTGVDSELMRNMLKATGKAVLVEKSARDPFWGCGADGQGMNMLGLLLMNLRERLQ